MQLTNYSGIIVTARTLSARMEKHLWVACCLAIALYAGIASAADFPVSGTLTFNGTAAELPDGTVFAGSSYDGVSGEIADGKFVFPQGTLVVDLGGFPVTVTYQITQDNTSSGLVGEDSTVALTQTNLSLTILSAGPLPIGTCVFSPIPLELAGTASAAGLALADAGFEISPVGAADCGGYGSQINALIAGADTEADLLISGDFTPPSGDTDTIFANGFESP